MGFGLPSGGGGGGGGDLILLEEQVLVSANPTTFDFAGFSDLYRNYLITGRRLHNDTNSTTLQGHVTVGGSIIGGTAYRSAWREAVSDNTVFASNQLSSASWKLNGQENLHNDSESSGDFDMWMGGLDNILGPKMFSAKFTVHQGFSNTEFTNDMLLAFTTAASVIDGVRIRMASGTMSGILSLYGIGPL